MKLALSFLALASAAWADSNRSDWPMFRGPHGNGVTEAKNVPTQWSAKENVKWRTPLARPGNGSPVLVGDKIFLAGADDLKGTRRSLYCFDRATGKALWTRTVEFDKIELTHETNPHCASTPASDGQRVVVWHGTPGLFCYDLDGKELWNKKQGEFRHMWGSGSSPVIANGRVFLNCGPGKEVALAAYKIEDGSLLWRAPEPVTGNGENEGGKYIGSWCTPVIFGDQVLCAMPKRLIGYDAKSGAVAWFCNGVDHKKGELAYSAPIVAGGGLVVTTGGFNGPTLAVKADGKGDVTATRLWRTETGPQSIGTGVEVGGSLYVPDAGPNGLRCLDPATGKIRWKDPAGGKAFWSSIVLADGKLFALNQAGETVVFAPNPERFEKIAVNALGESSNATPAIANGEIVIRTDQALYRIGK